MTFCVLIIMIIVLGFLFFTLSSVRHFLYQPFTQFHKLKFTLLPLIISSQSPIQIFLNSLFYENIECLNKSDGLQISVQSCLTKDNTNVFIGV